MDYSDELIKKNIAASEASDFEYAKWYAKLPDEKKAVMFESGFNFVVKKIRADVRAENPFCTVADEYIRFVELVHRPKPKEEVEQKVIEFALQLYRKKSEQEWQARFKEMKETLGWSYQDIANFVGASSGDSIKASVNRKLPAFAKLAVCVFEKMKKDQKENITS